MLIKRAHVKLLQSCPTLCGSMDYSPPAFPVHGILQARILEWIARPSSKGSSQPRDRTHISDVSCTGTYHWCHMENPIKWGNRKRNGLLPQLHVMAEPGTTKHEDNVILRTREKRKILEDFIEPLTGLLPITSSGVR